MSFYNDQHNFQVQPEKVEKLDDEICPSPFCSFCRDWRVKLIFICTENFIFHGLLIWFFHSFLHAFPWTENSSFKWIPFYIPFFTNSCIHAFTHSLSPPPTPAPATTVDTLLPCAKTCNAKTVLSSVRLARFRQLFVLCLGPNRGIFPSRVPRAKPSLLRPILWSCCIPPKQYTPRPFFPCWLCGDVRFFRF